MRAASVGVAAAGVAVLAWLAAPVRWDGLLEPGAGAPVTGMALLALLFGTGAGVMAGLLRHRAGETGQPPAPTRRWAPVVVLLAVSAIAWWPFGLFVARFNQADHEPFGSSRVIEACVAWLAYVAIAYAWYRAVSGRAGRPLAGH